MSQSASLSDAIQIISTKEAGWRAALAEIYFSGKINSDDKNYLAITSKGPNSVETPPVVEVPAFAINTVFTDETGEVITIAFNRVTDVGLDDDGLTISNGVDTIDLTYVSGLGTNVHLYATDQTLLLGEDLTLDHNQIGDGLKDEDGNLLPDILTFPVTNNSTAP